MKIFFVCMVRDATEAYRQYLETEANKLERDGHTVYLPHRDTDPNLSPLEICLKHKKIIKESDMIYVFYNPTSQGTHFDLGMAFALQKKICIKDNTPFKDGRSRRNEFSQMITEWEKIIR